MPAAVTSRKALIATAVLLLLLSLLPQGYTRWLTGPFNKTVETLQWPSGWVATLLKDDPPVDRPELTDQELLDKLEAAQKYNVELWSENARLKEQLDAFRAILVERGNIDSIRLVEANVSNYNNDRNNPVLKIRRGSLHGLKIDNAVAYKANLLGFVEEVGPATSVVSLITRPDFSIQVAIAPPGEYDESKGWPYVDRAGYDADERCFVCDVPNAVGEVLRPGDVVRVSDPLLDSANGFVLGVIDRIEDHGDRPLELDRVRILPRTPIGPQRRVTVLTDRPADN